MATKRMLEEDEQRLFEAIEECNVREVERLIRFNPSYIHSTDLNGQGVLHYASLCGNVILMGILLKAGADPNTKDEDQCTALHLAAWWTCPVLFDMLVKAGADPHAADVSQRTPFMEQKITRERKNMRKPVKCIS